MPSRFQDQLDKIMEISRTEFLPGSKREDELQREMWNQVCLSNASAVQFIITFGEILRTWDDLVDRDRPVREDDIYQAFWACLIELPQNEFYRHNQNWFIPLLSDWFNAWRDANVLERGDAHERSLAFVLRNLVCNVACQCALLIGGPEWMRLTSLFLRRFMFRETLEEYTQDLEAHKGEE